MWKSALLIIFVWAVAECCIYRDNECAPYTVDETHPDYEIRSYPALTWVTTIEESLSNRISQYNAFMRLFGYISGKNERALKINMTVPVRIKKTTEDSKVTIEMHFMVPSELANDPPLPNDEKIHILKEEPSKFAVRTFSGYVWRQATWVEEAEKLANSLSDDDTVDKTQYYEVGYDDPATFFDRRNEVWMRKKNSEESNDVLTV
ncbi:hypothetical protein JTE90_010140 [Oedothorax gibbosus]|uniref:Heme-binding protein 2 n=1 Tax=Oedothorax gibbosus TaxID=931172 RepID=A0AAV6UHN2_9ARAC|nr:hypothetical protein JTE90_010140 [Oedothorax gibbosus]